MADFNLTSSLSLEPAGTDLLRRRCPQLARLIVPDAFGCWLWQGSISRSGHGQTGYRYPGHTYISTVPVHRYIYDTFVATIPYGYEIHHRCEVRNCVNPLHLVALSHKEHAAAHGRGRKRLVYMCDARGQYLLFG